MSSSFPYDFPILWYSQYAHRRPYTVTVNDAAGNLIRIVKNIFNAKYSTQVKEPGVLTFGLFLDDDASGLMTYPNQVRLYDADENLVEIFIVQQATFDKKDGMNVVNVECYDRLSQMADEQVSGSWTDQTIETIVTAMFGQQTNHNALTLNHIDSAIGDLTRTISFDRQSLLQAIRTIEETVNADTDFYVSSSGQFNWILSSNARTGPTQILTTNRQCSFLSKQVDYRQQATRVSAYGKLIQDENRRLALSDHGSYAVNYLEADNTEYQNQRVIKINHQYVEIEADTSFPGLGTDPFPIHINITADAQLASTLQANAYDLIFLDDSGNALDYERISYNNSTGALECWVNVESLTAMYDTYITMVYNSTEVKAVDPSTSVDHTGGAGAYDSSKTQEWNDTFDNQANNADFITIKPAQSRIGIKVLPPVVEEKIEDADTLLEFHQWLLAQHSDPVCNYSVGVADLSRTKNVDGSDYDNYVKGSVVNLYDADLGIKTEVVVVGVERDLDSFEVQLELGNRREDIFDFLAAMAEQDADTVKELESIVKDPVEDLSTAEVWVDGTEPREYINDTWQYDSTGTNFTDLDADSVRVNDDTVVGDSYDKDTGKIKSTEVQMRDDSTVLSELEMDDDTGKLDYEKLGNKPDLDAAFYHSFGPVWINQSGL